MIFFPGWGMSPELYRNLIPGIETVFDYGFFRGNEAFVRPGRMDAATVIAGHSLGSMFALELAASCPEVECLLLFSPFARFSGTEDYSGQPHAVIRAMQARLRRNPARLLGEFLSGVGEPEGWTTTLPECLNATALTGGLDFLLEADCRELLDKIACRVMIVNGGEDRIACHGQQKFLAGCLRNCRVVEVSGAGHAVPFTSKDKYIEELLEFRSGRD